MTPKRARRLLPIALVAALLGTSAFAEEDTDEVARLRAYSTEIFRQVEALRKDLIASEKARRETEALLESVTKRLRDQLDAKQSNFAQETVRPEKEVVAARREIESTKLEEARQAARATDLAKRLTQLRGAAASGEADRKKLAAEIAGLEHTAKELTALLAEAVRGRQKRTTELEAQSKRLGAARQEVEQLRGLRADDAAAAGRLSAELEKLRAAAANQAAAKQKLESEVAERGRERAEQLAALQQDLAKTEQQGQQRLQRLEAQAKELESARQQLQSIQTETDQRKQKAAALEQEIERLRVAAREREADIQRQAEEQRLRDQQSQLQIASLTSRAGRLEEELTRNRADHERQTQELRRLADERLDLANRLESVGGSRLPPDGKAALEHRLGEIQTRSQALDTSQRQGDDRLRALEADLRQVREREEASRASASDLQQKLAREKRASQSKLEALRSVLANTRSASAEVRTQLDEARKRNAELSQQVVNLDESVQRVHDLQTRYQQQELRVQELEHSSPDSQELRDLRAQQEAIATALAAARSKRIASAASVSQMMSSAPALDPGAEPVPGESTDLDRADLREQLSVERERRETLEKEIERLTASGNAEEKFVEVWNALQSARAQILVLANQLTDERKSRESLELALARLQQASGAEGPPSNDFVQRLAVTLSERRTEADRLADEIKNANEIIVRLKGHLEASGSPLAENKILSDLDKENDTLRSTLKAAEQANQSLRTKAQMAERLADIVYRKSQ